MFFWMQWNQPYWITLQCTFFSSLHQVVLLCSALNTFALLLAHTVALFHRKLDCPSSNMSIALRCIALHCIALHCVALHCVLLHCVALCCIALHCILLYCIALHWAGLYCTVSNCILQCVVLDCPSEWWWGTIRSKLMQPSAASRLLPFSWQQTHQHHHRHQHHHCHQHHHNHHHCHHHCHHHHRHLFFYIIAHLCNTLFSIMLLWWYQRVSPVLKAPLFNYTVPM